MLQRSAWLCFLFPFHILFHFPHRFWWVFQTIPFFTFIFWNSSSFLIFSFPKRMAWVHSWCIKVTQTVTSECSECYVMSLFWLTSYHSWDKHSPSRVLFRQWLKSTACCNPWTRGVAGIHAQNDTIKKILRKSPPSVFIFLHISGHPKSQTSTEQSLRSLGTSQHDDVRG